MVKRRVLVVVYQYNIQPVPNCIDLCIKVTQFWSYLDYLMQYFIPAESPKASLASSNPLRGKFRHWFRRIIPGVCLAQFSLNNVHKRGLKHHHFISFYIDSLKKLQCKRVTHGTETLSIVVHRGCHVQMVTPAATPISVRFTCWNSDLLQVEKTACSREDTSASHSLLHVRIAKYDYVSWAVNKGITST